MKKTADQSSVLFRTGRPVLPDPLCKGDTIGLIAPAGSISNKKNFTDGLDLLEKNGFRVKYDPRIFAAKDYLAGSDQERALVFNRLWADPEIKGVVAARGGYGSIRMLHLIDMNLVREQPKILVGFSDLSVLLAAVTLSTNLVTYHGPVLTKLAQINKKSLTSFFRALMQNSPPGIPPVRFKILRDGTCRGTLLGGNLTTLVHTIGTPYEIPWDRAVLFIEDTGESPYRLDRYLTHLNLAGRLQRIKGLIIGTFTDAGHRERSLLQNTVEQRARELLAETDIPVWSHLPVGHGRRNITLPIGLEVEMNSSTQKLSFLK